MTVNEINIARVNRAYDKAMELIFRRPKKDGTKYPLYYRFSISKILRTRKSKIWHQFYIEADTFMKWLFPHIPQPGKSQKSTGPYARQIILNKTEFEILCEKVKTKELEPLIEKSEETQICAYQKKWTFCNTFLSYTNRIRRDYKGKNFKIKVSLISADRVS